MHFQSTVKQHVFLSLQRRFWVVSWLWTRFSDSDCKRSRPRNDNKFPRNTSGSLKLVLSQRQEFLNNHLARVPVTPNQQGTHEMRDDILSSVGAEDLNTSEYQVSDLDDVEFYWENDQLDVDAVLRPGIDTPFSSTAFDNLEMGGSAENPILLDEEDKENSPPTTPVWETNTTPCIAENLSIWMKNRSCSWLCF